MKSGVLTCCVAAILLSPVISRPVDAQVGTEAEGVVRALNALDERVLRIGTRLAISGAPLCAKPAFASGMAVQTASQYGAPYRAAAARLLGIGDRPTITVVLAGSPAERAGARRGDQIVAIDAAPFVAQRGGRGASAAFDIADAAMAAIDSAFADGRIVLDVSRGAESSRITIIGERACASRFDVRAGGSNASANGTYVQLSSNLVQSLETDDDLAAVVAHELAHNILRHPQLLESVGGGLLPGFGKSGKVMRSTEIEADRLSMYLLALAGFPLDNAVKFWSKFGRAHDYGVLSDRTHPGWKQRVAAMRVEIARIEQLRRRGEPVRPLDLPAATSSGTSGDRPPAPPR